MPRKTDMSFSTFYLRWILLPALWVAGFPLEESEMHTTDRRTADFVAGLVFQLQCDCNSPNESVSWSRVPSHSLENIGGISIKGDVLWFVPAQPVHSGEYSCLCREDDETWETIFTVSVQNKTCPPMNRKDEIKTTEKLECFLPHIFELDPGAQVTWRNNCLPLNVTNGKVFLLNRSSDMVGLYTCFVNFTFEGRNYSAAQTTQIYNQPTDFVVTRPEIIYPKKETHTVTLGERYNLSCKALVGKNDMDETSIFWISDSESLTLNYTNTILKESGQKYLLSVLSISKVTEEYLNTNLTCTVQHPAGSDCGSVLLLPASQKECHYWIGFGLVALVTLLGAVAFLCRVDLVLAHRGVCPSAARRRGYY